MAEFRLRPRAIQDLEGIWDYSATTWSPDQANRYTATFFDTMKALADDLERGRSTEDIRAGYRRQRCGSHVIFYKRAVYGIDVVRILHNRMDFGARLRDQ